VDETKMDMTDLLAGAGGRPRVSRSERSPRGRPLGAWN